MKKLRLAIAFVIFLATLAIYTASPITAHTDSIWSLYLSTSLVRTGDFNLDEYSALIPPDDYRTEHLNGHIYSFYPIGTPLMAAPVVYLLDHLPLFNGANLSAFLASRPPGIDVWQVEKFVASTIVALNAMVVFALALQYLNVFKSVILTVIFALATPAWSTASRGLWQHGPTMLCLSIALYLVVLAKRKPALSPLVALPLALSYVVRPTNIVSIAVFTLFIFMVHRRYFWQYVLCLIIFFTPFFIYNYSVYKQVLPSYYMPQLLGNLNPIALVGTLISPSRGLVIFSPILLLSFYSAFRRITHAGKLSFQEIDIYLVGILILHWLVISASPAWYGGWSVGPRYFTDMVPYLTFFLIPVLEISTPSSENRVIHKIGIPVFICLAAFSIFVHYRCSTNIGPTQWNGIPNDIDSNQYRLWDWTDIQFLRNLCPGEDYQAPKCWFYATNVTPPSRSLSLSFASSHIETVFIQRSRH